MADPIVIVNYDPVWPKLFEAEQSRLLSTAGEPVVAIHDIGSTAVPGLAAKPIVDILIVLRRYFEAEELAGLADAGYEYLGENGIAGRQFFMRAHGQAVHVHAFIEGSPEIERHLSFAAYLRDHPERAQAYEALKRGLALRHRDDRAAYSDGKSAFVRDTETLAGRR